jgi:hypothetical protein
MAIPTKIGGRNFHNFALQNETGLHGFATALGIAAALAAATVLAFAAVIAAFATAQAFAGVFALAVVFTHVAARRIGARRVGALILRVGLDGNAREQSGDGRGDEECSLSSVHIVYSVGFCLRSRRQSIHLPHGKASGIRDRNGRFIPDNF